MVCLVVGAAPWLVVGFLPAGIGSAAERFSGVTSEY
jgi:hypothetical protein